MASASVKRVLEASSRVFGHAMPQDGPSGLKLLRQPFIGKRVESYYPDFRIQRYDPLYESHYEARRKQALERKKRRGQGPPRKGEGKRQKKRR